LRSVYAQAVKVVEFAVESKGVVQGVKIRLLVYIPAPKIKTCSIEEQVYL
jgi:hypothetical protein